MNSKTPTESKPRKIEQDIRRELRRLWMISEARKEALSLAKLFPGWWQCASCGKPTQDKEVDHKTRVGKTPALESPEWGPWLARLFCPSSALQILCPACHNRKTTAENEAAKNPGQGLLFSP